MKLGIELRKMVEQNDIPVKKNWFSEKFYWLKVRFDIWCEFDLVKGVCRLVTERGEKDHCYFLNNQNVDFIIGLAAKIREEEMNATIKDSIFGKFIHIEW